MINSAKEMEEIKPKKFNRRMPWVLGSLVFTLFVFLILLQSSNLWKSFSADTASDTLLLYALSSLNFVAFIVFGFIFLRSIIKLARERRSLASRGDSAATRARVAALRDSLLASIPPTPFATLIDHFDHIARVAGVDHVGIGSDFDGVTALPAGMEDVTALPRIAQALLDRGYSDADVIRMLGGNMLRVMRRVLDRPATLP